MLALDSLGKTLWAFDLPEKTTAGTDIQPSFMVDTNGNVAVQHRMRYVEQSSGNPIYPGMQLDLLSGLTGILVSTQQLVGYDWSNPANRQPVIGKGVWYVPAMRCTAIWDCDTNSAKLYGVKVPGLQMDYPRGAIVMPVAASLNYVAMGDSFSSGEGVPGFDANSDKNTSPKNACHRSTSGAYPRLLAATPSLGLKLTSFVACSGAKIARVTKKWPTITEGSNGTNSQEAAQITALSASTKVVTLTLGGNDVPFKELTTACLFADCSSPAVNQNYYANIATLSSTLVTALGSIHSAAPNAKVYVIGYPQLLPATGCSQTDGWMVALSAIVGAAHLGDKTAVTIVRLLGLLQGLSDAQSTALINSGVVEFSIGEIAVLRGLVVRLNQAIKDATQAKPWLVYVDTISVGSPFIGHELCTEKSYFNGLTINPLNMDHDLAYSYHPNIFGQDAYRLQLLQLLG